MKHLEVQIIFFVYACYCFVMSTVFQAFFTAHLVERGYGKKFETFNDLLRTRVAYGYNDAMESALSSTSYEEYQSFPYWRGQYCNNIVACKRRIANNAQLCTGVSKKMDGI